MTTVGVTPDDEIREYPDREEEIVGRNRQADDAWETYRRTGQFAGSDAVMAWLEGVGNGQGGSMPGSRKQSMIRPPPEATGAGGAPGGRAERCGIAGHRPGRRIRPCLKWRVPSAPV